MSATVTYLSTTVRIGGNTIMLKTDRIPSLEQIENSITTAQAAIDEIKGNLSRESVSEACKDLQPHIKQTLINLTGDQAIIDSKDKFKKAIANKYAASVFKMEIKDNGLTFRMEEDQMISVRLGSVHNWVKESLQAGDDELSKKGLPSIFNEITNSFKSASRELDTNKLDTITVDLWNVSLNTKGIFTFNVQVNFDQTFYDKIGIPKELSNIFSVDKLGVGVRYEKGSSTHESF